MQTINFSGEGRMMVEWCRSEGRMRVEWYRSEVWGWNGIEVREE